MEHRGNLYESLSLAVVSVMTGDPFVVPVTDDDEQGHAIGLSALQVGGFTIPVDDQAAALIPYRGREGSFPYVSAELQQRHPDGTVVGNRSTARHCIAIPVTADSHTAYRLYRCCPDRF